jgi:hypothetical protein
MHETHPVMDGTDRGHPVAVVEGWEVLKILKTDSVLSLAFGLGKAA